MSRIGERPITPIGLTSPPPPEMELQPYVTARLISPAERVEFLIKKGPLALTSAYDALATGKNKDYQLANLDDVSRASAVALGCLQSTYTAPALPMWLGAASWLGSMKAIQWFIYGLANLKTGVNLGLMYRNSDGVVQRLLMDPQYLPLDRLPEKDRMRLIKRFQIDPNAPDADHQLRNHLQSIVTQVHTLWMVTAGILTPVVTSFFCDQVEMPLKRLWTAGVQSLRASRASWRMSHPHDIYDATITAPRVQSIVRMLDKLVDTTVGPKASQSRVSLWWQRAGRDLMEALGLDPIAKGAFLTQSEHGQTEAIAQQLKQAFQDPNRLEVAEARLNYWESQLNTILEPAEKQLNRGLSLIEHANQKAQSTQRQASPLRLTSDIAEAAKAELMTLEQRLIDERHGAQATLAHIKRVVGMASGHASPAEMKQAMEQSVLALVEQYTRHGKLNQALELTTGLGRYEQVWGKFKRSAFWSADKQMGASVSNLFKQAMESTILRKRWQRRYVGYLGGATVLASIAYTLFVMGRLPQHGAEDHMGGRTS